VSSHLAIPVMEVLVTPSRDRRDSEMESDQRSRSNLDLTAEIVSRFRISRIREVREPRSFDFPVSDMTIFRHVSYGPNGSDLVVISTLHRPSSCLINGPQSLVI
jgi:hypothetical protein